MLDHLSIALLLASTLGGQALVQAPLSCARLKVLSVSTEIVAIMGRAVELSPALVPCRGPRGEEGVEIVGPVLGSMDALTGPAALQCTATGIAVSVAITRSAGFSGDTAKNAAWRPHTVMLFERDQENAGVVARWTMRLSTGEPVTSASTPTYPEQQFPATLRARLPLPSHPDNRGGGALRAVSCPR